MITAKVDAEKLKLVLGITNSLLSSPSFIISASISNVIGYLVHIFVAPSLDVRLLSSMNNGQKKNYFKSQKIIISQRPDRLRPTQFIHWIPKAVSPGVKWQWRDADY
jgi:hypothetical protein